MNFLSVLIMVSGMLCIDGANLTGNSSIFDDRININTNIGHAHAVGKDGSFSGSDTSSLGYNIGILHPGGHYNSLGGQTSSKSNSYSSGRRPPSTFANSGVQEYGRKGIKGNVQAGYSGGKGQAYTNSQSQQLAIPLFGGAVLLSNLPEGPTKSNNATTLHAKDDTDIDTFKKPEETPNRTSTSTADKLFLN